MRESLSSPYPTAGRFTSRRLARPQAAPQAPPRLMPLLLVLIASWGALLLLVFGLCLAASRTSQGHVDVTLPDPLAGIATPPSEAELLPHSASIAQDPSAP